MAEAKTTVAEYVAANGKGPAAASSFGLNTGVRNSDIMYQLGISPDPASGAGLTFYLSAAIYESVWAGGTKSASAIAYFALSGETNSDGTMTWKCIPGDGAGGTAIEAKYLPANCRG